MRISDWSSDVCSSDLADARQRDPGVLRQLSRRRRSERTAQSRGLRRPHHPLGARTPGITRPALHARLSANRRAGRANGLARSRLSVVGLLKEPCVARRCFRCGVSRTRTAATAPQDFSDRRARKRRSCSASASPPAITRVARRSEEHTSELQSLMRISYAVFCLKKKKQAKET